MTLTPYFPLASGLAHREVPAGRAPPPEGTRLAAWGPRGEQMLGDDQMDLVERFDDSPRAHGPHAARARVVVDRGQPGGGHDHRRCHVSRSRCGPTPLATVAWKLSDAERREIDGMVPA